MKSIEIVWKEKEDPTKFDDVISWKLHEKKDLLIVEEFEDLTHYFNLDLIEGFTVEDDRDR